MVKKAIIAAAGRGTRFLPITKVYSKELLPVLNKPIVQYLVEELLGAGIQEIAIVHRPGDSSIRDYFSPNSELEDFFKKNNKSRLLAGLNKISKKARLHFFPQGRHLPGGSGSPVLAAKSFIGNQPFVYMFGDDLVLEKSPGRYLSSLLKTFQKGQLGAVIAVQKVAWEKVCLYGTMKFKKKAKINGQIEAIIEGAPKGKAPSNFADFGRFVVSPRVTEILKSQKLERGSELMFTTALTTLAKEKPVITQLIREAKWLTTGDPENWLKANLEFQRFFF
jgi:UTP--glucose-1-phosphate uridylyltransferase